MHLNTFSSIYHEKQVQVLCCTLWLLLSFLFITPVKTIFCNMKWSLLVVNNNWFLNTVHWFRIVENERPNSDMHYLINRDKMKWMFSVNPIVHAVSLLYQMENSFIVWCFAMPLSGFSFLSSLSLLSPWSFLLFPARDLSWMLMWEMNYWVMLQMLDSLLCHVYRFTLK